jgi:hypothetical protein
MKMVPSSLRKLVRKGRKHELTWRYVYNLRPTVNYLFDPVSLRGETARILRELNEKGIAITSAEALFGSAASFEELSSAVERIENERSDELGLMRAEAENADTIGRKTFISQLLGDHPQLNPSDIFGRFTLDPTVLQIANAYFGMFTRLRYYNVWHTFSSHGKARESQLWHQDREDFLILKMFVYLRDVTEGAGPFTYVPRTHPKGRLRATRPEYTIEGGVERTTDEQMAAVAPPKDWIKAVGTRGTIIFADTRGYHKGGLARSADRIMYTSMFTSQASESEEWFQSTVGAPVSADARTAFAMSLTRR